MKAVKVLNWSNSILFTLSYQRPSLEQWDDFKTQGESIPIDTEITSFIGNICEKANKLQQRVLSAL